MLNFEQDNPGTYPSLFAGELARRENYNRLICTNLLLYGTGQSKSCGGREDMYLKPGTREESSFVSDTPRNIFPVK
jgi:hypothetical protein